MIKKPQALSVSLVIPAFNEERHIRGCLEAVQKQTVMPDEVIVVDNNCTDDTIAIAQSFPFVRVISEAQQGPVYARDAGFNAARSAIIGRIDADTLLPPGWVQRVHKFYSSPTHANHALTGGCYFYNIRLPHFWGWWQGQVAFRMNRLLLGHYILFGSNMAMPKPMWQAVRSQVCHRNDIHEDLDLAIHTHAAGYEITYRESLRVGINIKRVRSQHHELLPNLMLWPQTLKVHGKKTWVFGWLGAIIIYCLAPIGPFLEFVARLFGRPPLPD